MFPHTKKYIKFKEEKERAKKRKEKESRESKRSVKLVGALVLTIIVVSLTLYFYQFSKEKSLEKNKVFTTAIVKRTLKNDYRMNDMDGTYVYTFVIHYEFITDSGEKINSIFEVQGDQYHLYFDKYIQPNDTIVILYNSKKPKFSKIAKK